MRKHLETTPQPKIDDSWLAKWFLKLGNLYKNTDIGTVFDDRRRAAEEREKAKAKASRV